MEALNGVQPCGFGVGIGEGPANHIDSIGRSYRREKLFKMFGHNDRLEKKVERMVEEYCIKMLREDEEQSEELLGANGNCCGRCFEVYATFGALFGVDDSQARIRIPVLTEVVLDPILEGEDFQFVETCEAAKNATVHRELVLPAENVGWNVSAESSQILEIFSGNRDNSVRCVRKCDGSETFFSKREVASCTAYRGGSMMHIKFCLVEVKQVTDGTQLLDFGNGEIRQHKSTIYQYQFNGKAASPDLRLVLIEKECQNGNNAVDSSVVLRLAASAPQLLSQLARRNKKQPNCYQRVIADLVKNARKIASIFDSVEDEESMRDLYFPNFFGDVTALSRAHYNMKQQGQKGQKESGIEFLRKMNNEVKRLLINEFVPENAEVWDLACGHGQDLQKYRNKNPKRFLGVDISAEEIKEAKRRLNEQKDKNIKYPCSFHVKNIQNADCWEIAGGSKFDVISIQLAIHYCLQSERAASLLMERISSNLKEGGVFIGSTTDCDVIAQRLVASDEHNKRSKITEEKKTFFSFGNDVYGLKLDTENMMRIRGDKFDEKEEGEGGEWAMPDLEVVKEVLRNTWGLKYDFWLTGHIGAPEFVVPWTAFEALAKKFNLQFASASNFKVLCKQYKNDDGLMRLVQKFGDKRAELHDQFEVFSFYKAFAFRKITTLNTTLNSEPEAFQIMRPIPALAPNLVLPFHSNFEAVPLAAPPQTFITSAPTTLTAAIQGRQQDAAPPNWSNNFVVPTEQTLKQLQNSFEHPQPLTETAILLDGDHSVQHENTNVSSSSSESSNTSSSSGSSVSSSSSSECKGEGDTNAPPPQVWGSPQFENI